MEKSKGLGLLLAGCLAGAGIIGCSQTRFDRPEDNPKFVNYVVGDEPREKDGSWVEDKESGKWFKRFYMSGGLVMDTFNSLEEAQAFDRKMNSFVYGLSGGREGVK